MSSKLLVKNIGLLVTGLGNAALSGAAQDEMLAIRNAYITATDGVIDYVGTDMPDETAFDTVIDADGKLVTPGLVDAHSHLVFGGWRQHEVPLKLSGAGYLEILAVGGGILDTVRQTRATSEDELFEKAKALALESRSFGVTSMEVKSGYGLNIVDELKQLNVVKRLNETGIMDFTATFLGAHAVPKEFSGRPDDYVTYIINEVLPEIKNQNIAEFVDIFCESGVFSAKQSERLLKAAKDMGYGVKIHADEIESIGGSELAGQLAAISAEHLLAIKDSGIESLKQGGSIACLLPGTSFYLNKNFAPAGKLIEAGVPVALGSDFNPGSCPSLNMQFIMNLGYVKLRMTPPQILNAVTLNAAAAMNRADKIGSLEVGKQADIVIWDAPDFLTLIYRFGSNLVNTVIKNSKPVYTKEDYLGQNRY